MFLDIPPDAVFTWYTMPCWHVVRVKRRFTLWEGRALVPLCSCCPIAPLALHSFENWAKQSQRKILESVATGLGVLGVGWRELLVKRKETP